ncbi:hypothetical protein R69658_07881 [Paraburkholderia aspalathi]|uniref:S1 motif domain-containing protein n=1 Tax=Paraburkholderia aspalathi TaxID=1324617 RepID=A0ABN7NCU5_9BURK|nr:hypothetical protein [Paraburkholderia aspalathi]MBK3835985.1 hypothetical protein [Paraburkholderia aspalathi]MBK3865753.1 hypothetical protein [Paraburkholderia aspalathi]CAE6866302.1 hypothetical protein R69658_07881 [Paraburkholderia aspalathi]
MLRGCSFELSRGSKTLDYDLPNGMRVQYGASALSRYLTSILSSVFEHDKYVRRMLVGLTARNIRKALEIFVEFCTSGHIREDEIFKITQKNGVHTLPLDVVSRVLLRMNRRHYDSDFSYLKNLLAADSRDDRPFYFTRLAILRWLHKHFSDSGPSNHPGYFPVSTVKETLAPLGIKVEVLTREIEYLVVAQCITTEDFSISSVSDDMLIRLAPAGFVHLEMLENTSYLAAIAEDTYFDTEDVARRVAGRINNVTSQYSDESTLENAHEVLKYFEDMRSKYNQLPHAYLSSSPFFELTDLSAARAAVDAREKGFVPAPWISGKEKYTVGSEHECVVTSAKTYGVIVELEPGVWGLIHHDTYPPGSNRKYLLQVGDKILATVTSFEAIRTRIGLTYVDHIAGD